MSHEPIQTPQPRRRGPQPQRAAPGVRRPLSQRLPHPRLPPLQPKTKKALSWTAIVLAILAALIAILVAVWDWNWFRGPLANLASARLHRRVAITGDLNVDLWSWRPSATVDGVSIANPPWAGPGKLGDLDRIQVKIRLVPLLWGKLDIRSLRFDRPNFALLADALGRKNWDFSNGADKTPMKLPPIHNFVINQGQLRYVDAKRDIRFEGVINAHERLNANNRGFELTGHGTINGAPFQAAVTGGPLLNIDKSKPYPFNADIRAGATVITAKGAVPKPFDLGQFYMDTTARGPDMAKLFPLTGVALPNTPPYSLRGRLIRDDLVWRVEKLGGRVGDSDLTGRLSVTTGGVRPFLSADLYSRSLDFDDLGALMGGAPKAGRGETASPEQAAKARAMAAEHRILPDAPLDVKRIRAMDADVSYTAGSIRDAPVKLTSGAVHLKLDDGLLRADPVRFDLPQGRVAGHVSLDARKAAPFTDLDLRLSNARIEHIIPMQVAGGPPVTGALVGRAKLSGSGDSVHKALAHANGQVTLVAPSGEVRKAFAELAGTNVIKGLGLLSKHDTSTTPIRCAVADFKTTGGVMRADNIVVDTGPVLIKGAGTINLDTEQMDFKVQGHDKKFRLMRVLLPVHATGPMSAPKLGVEPGKALAQGGIAVALGSLLSPLAAILPFVDPGLAKDANCQALLADAAHDGAPVKHVATAKVAKR